jgi:3'(2'), 5'-bisphosphate nucleotidase
MSASSIDTLSLAGLRAACVDIAQRAGAAIMAIYAQDFAVESKADDSPLTAADLAAHRIICESLAALAPGIPVLSEESAEIDWEIRRGWSRYWLVDPLDGTREFVKKNGEFTVNIALIENHAPVLGMVYAPALDYLVHAQRGVGAFLRDGTDDVALHTRCPATPPLQVAASRSHLDARTLAVLERIGEHERIGLGSSLKFCRIAEGRVDVYPRFGPTSEWDTAAGQCVLECAGGVVLRLDGMALDCNRKASLLNPDFIALGDAGLPWRTWLHD